MALPEVPWIAPFAEIVPVAEDSLATCMHGR